VKFVKNISTNAAMIFGLYPEKGVIQSGSDADLVIWDAEKEFTIDIKNQKQNTDINIYQDYQGKGMPSMVIKKGELIIKDNIIQKEVKGEFIKRKVFENIKL
jgi:dihydropyrimidinase